MYLLLFYALQWINPFNHYTEFETSIILHFTGEEAEIHNLSNISH